MIIYPRLSVNIYLSKARIAKPQVIPILNANIDSMIMIAMILLPIYYLLLHQQKREAGFEPALIVFLPCLSALRASRIMTRATPTLYKSCKVYTLSPKDLFHP